MHREQFHIAKITRPVYRGAFQRERLFNLLQKGLDYRCTWISGAPGSGKTTLVSSFIDTHKAPCLWYRLDELDSDIATFFYYMGKAARKASPRKGKQLPLFSPEDARMLKFISRNILTGLVTILPVALTIYLLYWMAVSAESVLGSMIRSIFPEVLYWPGIGVIATLVVAFAVGLLMNAYVVQQLFARGEQILYRMPLIKSVYKAIRDFFQYFSPTAKKEFEQVVAVSIGDTGMTVIGFVTQAVPKRLPGGFGKKTAYRSICP